MDEEVTLWGEAIERAVRELRRVRMVNGRAVLEEEVPPNFKESLRGNVDRSGVPVLGEYSAGVLGRCVDGLVDMTRPLLGPA